MSKRKKHAHAQARPATPAGDAEPEATSLDPAPAGASEADTTEADTTEADAHEADAHEADTHEADTHEADTTEAETPEITEVTQVAAPPAEPGAPVETPPEEDSTDPVAAGESESAAADDSADEPTLEISIDAAPAGEGDGDRHGGDGDGFHDGWEEPTRVAAADQLAELAAQSAAEPGAEGAPPADDAEQPPVDSQARLESIIESLLFAADRPLALTDLKRLVNERDGKKLIGALDSLQARHAETGIHLASSAGGWQFRTNPENATWVAKLVAGRPARLSRAMLETLAIVAYRQPITRPEIDEIRGVDCGPVLKTLLDRALVRMIGKKEEVGRPILYGTTPEFLRTFSLRDLNELPTLRQFHELGAAEQAKVDAETPKGKDAAAAAATPGNAAGAASSASSSSSAAGARAMPAPVKLPEHDADEEDALLAELDDATTLATRAATRSAEPNPPATAESPAPEGAD